MRLDVNVPLKNYQVVKEGAWRLERSLPTIKYLLSKGAKVIIFGKSLLDFILSSKTNPKSKASIGRA